VLVEDNVSAQRRFLNRITFY